MSGSGFWIKRNDHVFEAESWDMICHWTQEGRVKLSDLYKTPHTHDWLEVRRDPTLSGLIPKSERLIIKRGDVEYRAPSFDVVKEWARRGQVSPDDMIYSSYTRLWARVEDIASIMEHIPHYVSERVAQRDTSRRDVTHQDSSRQTTQQMTQEADSNEDKSDLRADVSSQVSPRVSPRVSPQASLELPPNFSHHMSEDVDLSEAMTLMLPAQRAPRPDPQALCAPFYDVARLFIVIQALRPLERIKGRCELTSLELNCDGLSKREALEEVCTRLRLHVERYLPDEERALELDITSLYQAQEELISTLREQLLYVGEIGEERLVIGNANQPKMTPQESEAMLRIKSKIERLIQSAKAYKRRERERARDEGTVMS